MYNQNQGSQTQQQYSQQSSHSYVHPLQNNQQNQEIKPIQYPAFNQDKESIAIDDQECGQIITSDYLQQQNERLNPQRYQEPPQPLNQPLIHPIQPIMYQNDDDYMTLEQRRNLIKKINGWWILQTCIQIFLSIINMASEQYDNLFFDLSKNEYRITGFVIFVITFAFLLIVRFGIPIEKTRGNQFIYYATYCVLYSFLASSVVSAGHSSWEHSNGGVYFVFGLLYFFGSVGELIMLIQFHFQIKSFKEEDMRIGEFLKSVFYGPLCILLFASVLFGADVASAILFFMIMWALVFTLFYVSSLLQIYRGKFKLRQDQFFIGSVLTYVNMIFPCV